MSPIIALAYVTFELCPPFYCCPRLKDCLSYDTCMNNRKGRLCGNCRDNYVISLFTHNKCVNPDTCKVTWFWFVYFVVICLAFIILLCYKDVILYLKNKIQQGVARQPESKESEETTSSSYLLMTNDNDNSPNRPGESSAMLSGVVKITFFFYQAASIVRINASSKMKYQMPYFIDILTSLFNIKIDVQSTDFIDL